MEVTQQIAAEQANLWNGPAGRAWVESQVLLDRMFKPFEDLLVSTVASLSARRVLDVGCGTGATTLAVSPLLGSEGKAVGVDLSEPMIQVARQRAQQQGSAAQFIAADAATHDFGERIFDAVISRFGVMFFADPVQAFTNLRNATHDGGHLRCIAFRSAAENPFMTAAERAAAPLLPDLPARRAGPGQFAFADADRVHGILAASGWQHIDLDPIDVVCTFPAVDLDSYLAQLGPVGLALRDADPQTRDRVTHAVRAAFAPYIHGNEVRFTSANWMLRARSG
jgi:SAM-dependent methyltransferase